MVQYILHLYIFNRERRERHRDEREAVARRSAVEAVDG